MNQKCESPSGASTSEGRTAKKLDALYSPTTGPEKPDIETRIDAALDVGLIDDDGRHVNDNHFGWSEPPEGFEFSDDDSVYAVLKNRYNEPYTVRIAGRLWVSAHKAGQGGELYIEVSFLDNDGKTRRVDIPRGDLAYPDSVVQKLLQEGADVDPAQAKHVARYLLALNPVTRLAKESPASKPPSETLLKVEAEPYPIDALPPIIKEAVLEVQRFTQAPLELVASCAKGTASLATQGHINVRRAEKLEGPVSLSLLIIGDSGERKSTVDNLFMEAIRGYEARQVELAKPIIAKYRAAIEAWDSRRNGVKDRIRKLAKEGKPTAESEETLREIEREKLQEPRIPRLIYSDTTPEALKWNLSKVWPTGGIISAEAGIVFGGHGMNQESLMRNLTTLNLLWDGAHIYTERRTSESFMVRGARLTQSLQTQESTLHSFIDRSAGLARGTGFFSRSLLAWPESTQGTRQFCEPPASWPALSRFNSRIAQILETSLNMDADGGLLPQTLSFSKEAKAAWVRYHDAVESELRVGGELFDVRDVASKSADNAARLAALFQYFEHGAGPIGLEAFEGASRIAAWHLNESRRFFGEFAQAPELADAARLEGWLLDYCRREGVNVVSRRTVQQFVTPVHLRHRAALDAALAVLAETGRVALVQDGHRKEVHVIGLSNSEAA